MNTPLLIAALVLLLGPAAAARIVKQSPQGACSCSDESSGDAVHGRLGMRR
jgi:hypothetical protein